MEPAIEESKGDQYVPLNPIRYESAADILFKLKTSRGRSLLNMAIKGLISIIVTIWSRLLCSEGFQAAVKHTKIALVRPKMYIVSRDFL
jgi:hypothetical protein